MSTTERRGEAYGVQLWLVISFSMFQSWQLGEKKAVSEWVASSEALAVRSTTRESLVDRLFEADGKRRSRKQPAGCETLLAGCDPLADPTAASRSRNESQDAATAVAVARPCLLMRHFSSSFSRPRICSSNCATASSRGFRASRSSARAHRASCAILGMVCRQSKAFQSDHRLTAAKRASL